MNKIFSVAVALLLLAGTGSTAAGSEGKFAIVSTDEVKRMLDGKEQVVLANALSPIEFAEKHIPGSVNIPPEFIKSGEAALPEDKGQKILFYCMGPK